MRGASFQLRFGRGLRGDGRRTDEQAGKHEQVKSLFKHFAPLYMDEKGMWESSVRVL